MPHLWQHPWVGSAGCLDPETACAAVPGPRHACRCTGTAQQAPHTAQRSPAPAQETQSLSHVKACRAFATQVVWSQHTQSVTCCHQKDSSRRHVQSWERATVSAFASLVIQACSSRWSKSPGDQDVCMSASRESNNQQSGRHEKVHGGLKPRSGRELIWRHVIHRSFCSHAANNTCGTENPMCKRSCKAFRHVCLWELSTSFSAKQCNMKCAASNPRLGWEDLSS